ncbi:Gfo/Idh/MocA family oxidoreductase [Paenibacillus sp. IB182496]|uniref:Gfo/Idh/MocA family oxidoreductase n=2 Tax=Paenibacillus sabuli TaxID=2772509 RepID=A0A927GQL4_9BACL|nr:Gfo/Idh/MocA family oxidoreductase [Paenibacillus sabuli]
MGAGNISRKFAKDLAYAEGAELTAVASQTLEKAEKFAAELSIPRAYGSYEEFLKDDNVDIVYIGTLHPMHLEGILQCLRAGKAVLCEKPFTMNAEEAAEAVRVAREHDTFLMEAMWTRYLPPLVQARQWIEAGKIGEVVQVHANFGFNAGWNPGGRLLDKKLGGGALLDAGIYPVSFASMIFGRQPDRISSTAHLGETGVDERFSALFEYDGGQTALLSGAVRLRLSNNAYVYGTEGFIHLPNFLFGPSATLHANGEEPVVFDEPREANGYNFEAEEAMRCLREGRKESAIMPLDETQAVMQTLDTLRRQWGLEYE